MTDFLTTLVGDVRNDDAHPHGATAPSARRVDEEDLPQPSPGQTPLTHAWTDPSDDAEQFGPAPTRYRVVVPDELRTFHAPAEVLAAQTTTFAIGEGGLGKPRYLGLNPSRVQAQTIAYCVVSVVLAGTDPVSIVLDAGGSPSMRFRLTAGTHQLPGVAGVFVELDAAAIAAVTVSVLTVGRSANA
jgi:hypothetical protein